MIGPANAETFGDEELLSGYLQLMRKWEPPSAYGCTQRHRDRARKAWAKLCADMEQGASK